MKEGEEVNIHLDGKGRIVIKRLPKGRRILKPVKRLLPDKIEETIERGLAESIR